MQPPGTGTPLRTEEKNTLQLHQFLDHLPLPCILFIHEEDYKMFQLEGIHHKDLELMAWSNGSSILLNF